LSHQITTKTNTMTIIYSESLFNKQDVQNFLKDNEWKDTEFSNRFDGYGSIDYTSLKYWLNKNFTKGMSEMIMRKIECECVTHIEELHV